jgi:hypothetical protein
LFQELEYALPLSWLRHTAPSEHLFRPAAGAVGVHQDREAAHRGRLSHVVARVDKPALVRKICVRHGKLRGERCGRQNQQGRVEILLRTGAVAFEAGEYALAIRDIHPGAPLARDLLFEGYE